MRGGQKNIFWGCREGAGFYYIFLKFGCRMSTLRYGMLISLHFRSKLDRQYLRSNVQKIVHNCRKWIALITLTPRKHLWLAPTWRAVTLPYLIASECPSTCATCLNWTKCWISTLNQHTEPTHWTNWINTLNHLDQHTKPTHLPRHTHTAVVSRSHSVIVLGYELALMLPASTEHTHTHIHTQQFCHVHALCLFLAMSSHWCYLPQLNTHTHKHTQTHIHTAVVSRLRSVLVLSYELALMLPASTEQTHTHKHTHTHTAVMSRSSSVLVLGYELALVPERLAAPLAFLCRWQRTEHTRWSRNTRGPSDLPTSGWTQFKASK